MLYALVGLIAVFYLLPLVVMLITSFRSYEEIRMGQLLAWPQSWSLQGWTQAWSEAQIGARTEKGLQPYFINSFQIVIPAVAVSCVMGAINGYILSFWRFKYSELFFAALLFGCFLPFQSILLPMSLTLGWFNLSGTLTSLICVHVIYGLPFTTLFFRNFYVALPSEPVKAAKIEGAGFWQIFVRIILPQSTPMIVVSITWQFTMIWNDFLFGVVFSDPDSQPITVGLNNLVNVADGGVKRYNIEMAGALIAAIPTLLVYIFSGKYFVKAFVNGSMKG